MLQDSFKEQWFLLSLVLRCTVGCFDNVCIHNCHYIALPLRSTHNIIVYILICSIYT